MVLARPDERETWPYHCGLRLFTIVRRSSCGPIAYWILAQTSSLVKHGLCMKCVGSCGSTSFPWLVFFFGALLWESMIHKHTGRWMWQASSSVVSWSWKKYSCHSKLVSALSLLLLSVLSWSISGLEPSSVITEPRYLKLVSVSSFCPFTLLSVLIPLVLFVISLVFSALISMP